MYIISILDINNLYRICIFSALIAFYLYIFYHVCIAGFYFYIRYVSTFGLYGISTPSVGCPQVPQALRREQQLGRAITAFMFFQCLNSKYDHFVV